jgi:hypothetical protein
MEPSIDFPKPIENKYKYSVGKAKQDLSDKENTGSKKKKYNVKANSDRRDKTIKIKKALEDIYKLFKNNENWEIEFTNLIEDNIDTYELIPKSLNSLGSSLLVCSKF